MKKRPYFISFIGRWTKNAIRMELAHLHSRARPLGLKNVFLNSGYPVKKHQHGNAARNQTTGTDETQAVLGKSRFPLVLPGDLMDSTRFGEAVCAGGIPVLFRPLHGYKPPASLSKHEPPVPLKKYCRALELLSMPNASSLVATQLPCLWRPPHQESIPFASYGIALDNATSLLTDLIAIPPNKLEALRMAARNACHKYYRSTSSTLERMIQYYAKIARERGALETHHI